VLAALPCGLGLLECDGETLLLKTKPHWHEVLDDDRLNFLHRVAMAGTRSLNRENRIVCLPAECRCRGWPIGKHEPRRPQWTIGWLDSLTEVRKWRG